MNAPIVPGARPLYRSVFLSDTHLGTRGARCDFLANFLHRISCQKLFLVGDIFDGWRLRKSWYWDEDHDEVLRQILRHARGGAEVTYIPGNHDEMFRAWLPLGLEIAGIKLRREAEHVTADGKRLLVMHGDEFDSVVTNHHIITWFGDWCYDILLAGGRLYNWARRKFHWPYFSLAAYAKNKVKYIVDFVSNYQDSLLHYARTREADIIITGHIHRPEIKPIGNLLYANCGDWVENCSALVEHFDGRLEIIYTDRDEPTNTDTPVNPDEKLVESMPS